jgi:hypothetical protein
MFVGDAMVSTGLGAAGRVSSAVVSDMDECVSGGCYEAVGEDIDEGRRRSQYVLVALSDHFV